MNRQLSVHSPGSSGLLRTVTIGVPFGVTHLDTAGDTASANEAAADAEVAAINNAAAARRLGSPAGDCRCLPCFTVGSLTARKQLKAACSHMGMAAGK